MEKLWKFASEAERFELKDIKIALSEIEVGWSKVKWVYWIHILGPILRFGCCRRITGSLFTEAWEWTGTWEKEGPGPEVCWGKEKREQDLLAGRQAGLRPAPRARRNQHRDFHPRCGLGLHLRLPGLEVLRHALVLLPHALLAVLPGTSKTRRPARSCWWRPRHHDQHHRGRRRRFWGGKARSERRLVWKLNFFGRQMWLVCITHHIYIVWLVYLPFYNMINILFSDFFSRSVWP